MEPLVEAGAKACASAADVARQSDIVFTNVSDTADVEAVILGPDGIIHGAESGSVVVDDSTISPLATREMAGQLRKKGIEMLDAPVSGGEQGAIDGTLSMMVGGKSEVFERVRPLFEVLGRNIVLVGDNGAGQVAKMCNQVVIAQTMAAVGEAFTLAEAADVDPAKVREALLGGFAGSKVMEVHGQRMLDDNFAPGFKAKLHRKDMKIALETAAALGVGVPGAAVATQLINALVGAGGGELDSSALVTVQRRMSRND
jgi:2-hydroxy-3-oxopropionate reductase